MNYSSFALTVFRYGISLALLALLWAVAVYALDIPDYLLPKPYVVMETLFTEWPAFADAALLTFGNMAAGGAIGISLGLLLGCAAAYSQGLRWIVEPYLSIFQSFPRESLLPLFIVWLGFGAGPKILSSALLSFFPMAAITLNSLRDTRDEYVSLMETWNASRIQIYLFCRVPAAIPALVGGLKVCLPLALIGAVLGEFLGGNGGLGYLIMSSGSAFRTDRAFAAIILLAAGGLTIIGGIDAFRFLLLRPFYQK